MSNLNEKEIRDKSKESAKKAKQLSPSVQYAICQVLPNIRNGAFWGFTDLRDVSKHIEAIKSDNNITARKLNSNACLLEVVPNYLLKAVNLIDPNALTSKDIQEIQQSTAKAIMDFEKFLIQKAKTKGFGGTIGIYCTNNVTSISYKGVTYPAFRIAIGDALKFLGMYGYEVQVGGTFVSAAQAGQSGQALWDSAKLSPTKTGIFINIKSTYTPEQIKPLEAQYKAKYGLK